MNPSQIASHTEIVVVGLERSLTLLLLVLFPQKKTIIIRSKHKQVHSVTPFFPRV